MTEPNAEPSAIERLRTMMNVPPAGRPAEWGNPLEKIEELLSCAICLDRFKTPKLLQCQHTFCMDCLEGLADPVRRNLKCPECRAEHPLPREGIKGLQTNYTLMGFLEIHLQATEDNAEELEAYIKRYNLERCRICDEKAELDFCHHCQKKVCDQCRNTHIEMVKRDLGRLANQVKRLSNRITEASDGLSKGLETLSTNCEATKEDIKDCFRRMYRDLKKREENFLNEAETFHTVETRLMKGLRDSLELESSNVNEACAKVESLLKGEREIGDEELVRYKQMFADGLDFLRTFSLDADDLCMKKIRFNLATEAQQSLHLGIAEFGELQVCAPQFGGRFQQLEAHYVPRTLNIGLESDAAAKSKKRNFDINDTSTWGNQQQNGKGKEKTAAARTGTGEDSYSLRFRRRHQLEEEAWHRLRGDRKGEPAGNAKREEDGMQTSVHSEYARQQLEESPFSKVQAIAETAATPSPPDSVAGPSTLNVTPNTPRGSPSPARVPSPSTVKPTPEEILIDEKVEHIRSAHQKRAAEPSTSDAKKVASPPQFLKAKAAEKEKKAELPVYREIPVVEEPPTPAPPKSPAAAIDWKKYLIPSPALDPVRQNAANNRLSSFTAEEKVVEPSWSDRRSRFVRSKTNPDLLPSASQARLSEFAREQTAQKQPEGLRNSAAQEEEPAEHHYRKRERYRRKAERSGSALLPDTAIQPKNPYLDKGRVYRKFGSKGGGEAEFNWPRGVALVPGSEEIVVCDSSNHRVQIFDKRGHFLQSFGSYGSGKGEFDCLAGVAVNKYKQFVVTDRYNHRVQVFDSQGRFVREFGAHGQTNGRFNNPWGSVVDNQGFIYVCDKDNHRVQIFQADGNYVGKFGGIGSREGQFQNPHFIAVNRQNMLIVSDSSNHRVQVFDHNGHFQFAFGMEGFHDGQFKFPRGVAVDGQGFILVADSGNNRIQVFTPEGRFYCSFGSWGAGDGQLKGVEGVAVSLDGRVVVTDRENHRVQIF